MKGALLERYEDGSSNMLCLKLQRFKGSKPQHSLPVGISRFPYTQASQSMYNTTRRIPTFQA
jgi:hypothetical protein